MTAVGWGEPLPAPSVRQLLGGIASGFRTLHRSIDTLLSAPEAEPCLPLRGPDYPANWDTCQEAEWQALCDDVDGDEYLEYVRDGGTREFKDWQSRPCTECSRRHNTAEHKHRPRGPVGTPPDSPLLDLTYYGGSSQGDGSGVTSPV